MDRKKRVVVPTELEASIHDTRDVRHGNKDDHSGRGLLAAASTGVSRNKEDGEKGIKRMMSLVGEVVDEGLGEKFKDTRWVPPTVKRAEDNRAQAIYRGGKSSVWNTQLHELEDMGIGVSLYFQFLKFLSGTYFVLALLSMPSFLFAVTGQGFKEVESPSTLFLTMVGNVDYSCDEEELTSGCNSITGKTQNVFGTEYTHLEVSYYITAFEFVGSVFFIFAILYWRMRTAIAVKRVDTNKVTATDYAVYIEGLPKTTERNEIGQFFSDLYQLEAPDWKGRPPYEQARAVFNVENTEDKWYMGKWVAEVYVAREVGREVKAYKDKKDTVLKLRKKRAEAKMYNKGTPMLDGQGANPAKFTNAVKAADKLGGTIAKTTDRIMDMRKNIDGKQACVGCFIVFNHPLSLHRCMEDFSHRGMFKKYPKELTFQGTHRLKATKAPEPGNIIWENLEFPKWKRGIRQNVTGLLSFILLLMSFTLVLLATGFQENFANVMPKIEYCETEVPALYFSDYSKSRAVADDLKLVRPDASYRWDEDEKCQNALDDELAVYMVYTIEEGEESYTSPVLNYTLDACESGSDICPEVGDRDHCPCATESNFQMCETLKCKDTQEDPVGICGGFVFTTVSSCYCYGRLKDEHLGPGFFWALKDLLVLDWDICGSFAMSWTFAKAFNLAISFLTPIINGVLEACLKGLVSWEHNISDDETATRLMYRVFQTQFVNTGILFLLVYGTAPSGYETPSFIKNPWFFAGPYNDFSREWQAVAGTGLLMSYILAAIGPHFLPLINIFFMSKRRIQKATTAIEQDEGEYVMQSELNDVFVGPVFDFTTRYSYLLTLLFVTMAFSGGMFVMNVLSLFFFLMTYWVDKIGILRFYRRPPHREDALQRQVNNTLPWALLLHLCFTCWFLGTESLKSEVITESLSRAASYESTTTSNEEKFGILAIRLIRTNVFPLVVLTAGVFIWCVLEFVGKFFPVFAFLGKGLRFVAGLFTGKKRALVVMRPENLIRSRWTSEVAAYTDVYFQYVPENSDLTTAEKLEGWMVSHLEDKSVVKKKGWDMDEEAPPARRDAKFSWEVVRDNSIFTYHVDLVPGYAEIMAALKEEERLYMQGLAAESDGRSSSSKKNDNRDKSVKDDKKPKTAVTVPKKAAPVPGKAVTVPEKAAPVPGKAVTVPKKAAPVPKKAAPVPKKAAKVKTKKSKSKKASKPFKDFKAGGANGEAAAEDNYNPFTDFTGGMDKD